MWSFYYIKYLADTLQGYFKKNNTTKLEEVSWWRSSHPCPGLSMKKPAVLKGEVSDLSMEKGTESLQFWVQFQQFTYNKRHKLFYQHCHYVHENIKQRKTYESNPSHHTFLSAYFGSSGRTIIIFPSGYSAKILSFFQP